MSVNQMSRRKTVLLLVGLMASLLLAALDSTVVSTAMKHIAGDFNGMKYYSWPFTIYMLFSTIAVPVCGGLADIYGHKPLFLTGLTLFLIGSALCGASRDMVQLIVFRGVQGTGGGMIVSGVFTVVADLFEPADRGKYTGIVTSMYGLASIIGPLAGGLVSDCLNWRWVFYMNLPLGIAAEAVIALGMPGFVSGTAEKRVDFAGIAFLVLALVPMLLAFSMAGGVFAWTSVPEISLFLFSAVMAAVFSTVEKKSSNPLLPPAFFRDRAIGISFLIALFSQALMFSAIMYLPYFIQGVAGSTAAASGAIITPMMIGLLLASNLTGQFISRVGKAKLLSVMAFIIMGAGEFLLSTMSVGTPISHATVYTVILGFGVGISMPITSVNAQNAAPRQQIGTVTSSVMAFRNIGSTVSSAVYGAIMTGTLNSRLAGLDTDGLPENIRGLLKNTQAVTNVQTVSAIRNQIPKAALALFDKAVLGARTALAASISSVFLFGILFAVMGLVCACFLREAPVARGKMPDKSRTSPPSSCG